MPSLKQSPQIHIVANIVPSTGLHKAVPRVIYQQAEIGPEAEIKLNRAFDRLFEEVLKMENFEALDN